MLTLMNLSPYSDCYSHFKLYWKTFSAPNANYSNKYFSQSKFK